MYLEAEFKSYVELNNKKPSDFRGFFILKFITIFIKMKKKRVKEPKPINFIVVDEYLQAFTGLNGGCPQYHPDWDKAKPLQYVTQFETLQRHSLLKLEMIDWD
jgi:hypothetical protein